MELLVIGVVVLGIALFAVPLTRSASKRDRPSISTTPSSSRNNPTAADAFAKPAHFDERSAKQLEENRVLTGPAYVTDGDTIKIRNTQVRLFGIDVPELNHPYGKKAKWALQKICKGNSIRAEITDEDEYGRTVALCFLEDGRDISAEMVKQGLAIDWPKFSGGKYKDLETPDARKKLFLADARQKGRTKVWERYEARQGTK